MVKLGPSRLRQGSRTGSIDRFPGFARWSLETPSDKEDAMITLEIAGQAVAVTNADEEQARHLFLNESFKDDLKSFKSEGRPLWDGSAALTTRPASEDEIDAFNEVLDEEDEDGIDEDEDELGDIDVVFLVSIDEIDDGAASG